MSRAVMWWGLFGLGWFSIIAGYHDQAVSLFVGAIVLGELPKSRTE